METEKHIVGTNFVLTVVAIVHSCALHLNPLAPGISTPNSNPVWHNTHI